MTSPMLATAKFRRIAQDLEKLPCELHGDILDDLEFTQLIRISSCAGPGLTWSLENSVSDWGEYFRAEDMSTWQKLLSISDIVRHLCFIQPKTKGEQPYIFEKCLAFMFFCNKDWNVQVRNWAVMGGPVGPRYPKHQLASTWLKELYSIVIVNTWSAFHEHYARIVEPLLPKLPPQAKAVFSKVPDLGCKDAVCDRRKYRSQNPPFSVDDLVTFIDMYQQCRLLRAETLAAELYRLADIYEAHPTRLKEPFDLRIRAPDTLNKQHIPTDMRRQARKMISKAKNSRWKSLGGKTVRFAWPALVPFEREVELFHGGLADAADVQVVPAEMVNKCRAVIVNAPFWARDDMEGDADTETHLSDALEQQHLSLHGLTPRTHIRAYESDRSKREHIVTPVLPRGDAELEWLENFAEVTAWMEEEITR